MDAYTQAGQDCTLIDEEGLCWIEVKGKDARKFLNGVLTNDIHKLGGQTGCYCLMLTPKGKIIADCFCYTCGDHFGLVCFQSLKNVILENLKRYIIFQNVEVLDQNKKWGALRVIGPKTKGHFDSLLKTLPSKEFSYTESTWEGLALYVICKSQWGLPCYEFWIHQEELSKLKNQMNLPTISKEIQEVLRIESATPLFGLDMDEGTIPQEANLYNALSFDKGCYVGQEVIARLEKRGHVGKKLVQLVIEGKTPPKPGWKILSPAGEEVGQVTSSCFSPKYNASLALGFIRYQFLTLSEVKVGDSKAKVKIEK